MKTQLTHCSLLPKSFPILTKALFASALLLPIAALAAADAASEPATEPTAQAQRLIESNCTKCHGSEVYTRNDRRIESLDGLETQVQRCANSLELQWFDEEVMSVTHRLNSQYYHFKP
ncbi:hypothetical protein [Thiorhodovibrio frisius]|uniref:Green heme protein n=1 Tax=Thiorhodovibrio frisius TaxID=631362 RepID=H8Z8P9_9GAMM|nr:hypothetical protein [Thiorhodovibrio frisius]EIC19454.1 hypothetical protein Thi970DRAFT_04976 [Thiorhodovibrio frisius]WPL22243.1 Green heme protein [Thiorhodovibrio frisius]